VEQGVSNSEQDNLTEEQEALNASQATEEQDASDDVSSEQTDEGLAAKIAELEAQLAEAKDQSLRAVAEVQNIRRRAELDVEKAHKYALEKFVSDMLPVVDNLARAVDASTAEGAEMPAVIEGVELTLKSMLDALKRHNVEQVNPEGEPFNPELHQAMTTVPQPDVEPNTVINVYQCGYTLNGRLVRPAMVVVSKAE